MNALAVYYGGHKPMIGEAARSLGVISLSAMALAFGSADLSLIKELLQVLLIAGTLLLTGIQGYSISLRIRREKKLYELVDEARRLCHKAKDGQCPVEQAAEKIKQSKA